MADEADKANTEDAKAPITIKKYANRRLYNTATSSYVTLEHLSAMVKEGQEFEVKDAKTGEDITRSVLTHIIVEEEGKGQNLLPIGFLRHLISFYGDSLQSVVPNYLEHTMQTFARNQVQIRSYMQDALGGLNPFAQFEDVGKQNMAMFENALRIFTPYAESGEPTGAPGSSGSTKPSPTANNGTGQSQLPAAKNTNETVADEQIDDLRSQLAAMQRQLDALSDDKAS